MRKLIILLFFPALVWAQTVELSALNYGTHNGMTAAQRDAKFLADVQAMMDNHIKSADLTPILYHYTYTVNDSAFSFFDTQQDSVRLLERYVNYRSGAVVECPVELTWATISKHSPAKVSMKKYDTWNGGPWPKNIRALTAIQTAQLRKLGKELTDAVDAKCKADKTKKRKDAWAKVKAEKLSSKSNGKTVGKTVKK